MFDFSDHYYKFFFSNKTFNLDFCIFPCISRIKINHRHGYVIWWKLIKKRLVELTINSQRLKGCYCTLEAGIVISSHFVRNVVWPVVAVVVVAVRSTNQSSIKDLSVWRRRIVGIPITSRRFVWTRARKQNYIRSI